MIAKKVYVSYTRFHFFRHDHRNSWFMDQDITIQTWSAIDLQMNKACSYIFPYVNLEEDKGKNNKTV